MKCHDVEKLISDYSAGALSGRMARGMREHIESCPSCARELDRLSRIMSIVEQSKPIEPPDGLWNGVYNRITDPEVQRRHSRFGRFFERPRRALSLGAAIIVVAGSVIFGISSRTPQKEASLPEPATMEYVRGHLTAASSDAFADRVSLGVIAAMPPEKE